MLEAKLASRSRELDRAAVFLGSLIDQREDAFGSGEAALDVGVDARHRAQPIEER